MCYYVASKLSKVEIAELETEFNTQLQEKIEEDHYVTSGFSHAKLPVLTAEGKFQRFRWGLIPAWTKNWEDARKWRTQTLNAIGETIEEKPSFRGAVKAGRFCVVPVNGFYEWHHHTNGEKYPHFIYPKTSSVFLLAGLYEQWTNAAIDEVHNTFTIITTNANARMEWIHNSKKRMPAILSVEEAKRWLDTSIPFAEKKLLLDPYDVSEMNDHTISKLITSRKENPNCAEVMQPFEYEELK
jgi:putative SOS response-associated peptidase YedK